MSDNTKSCIAFIVVILVGCLLFWLGGYDFDTRGRDVAAGALMVLAFAVGFARLVRGDSE